MSMMSAALTLHAWTVEHGRQPKTAECRKANGLHHIQTYYEVFGIHHFSAGIMPMVSALVSSLKTRTCLGFDHHGNPCRETFKDQGAHVRMCAQCRRRHGNETDEGEYSITMVTRRLTLRELGAGRSDWDNWAPWVEQIDWDGGQL